MGPVFRCCLRFQTGTVGVKRNPAHLLPLNIHVKDIDDKLIFEGYKGPVIAYHGTTGGIQELKNPDPEKSLGIHFGTPEQARFMALERSKQRNETPRILKAALYIQNPLLMHDTGFTDPKVMSIVNPPHVFAADELKELGEGSLEQWRYAIRSKGYDSVTYQNSTQEGPGYSYIVFNPDQFRILTTIEL